MRDFSEMGKSIIDVTKDIFGIGGAVESIRQISSAFVDFAKGRVTLQNFAKDTRLSTHDIVVMRRAMEYMGTSADTADTYIASLTTKLQQLRAFKESSPLFQDLTKMGAKGNVEAQLLLSDTQRGDYKKGIMDILDFYKSQGPRQQFYLSQILGVPQSILQGLAENMRKVQDVYDSDDAAAKKAYENWVTLKNRWSDEWDRFSDHAVAQINDFWDKMEAQSGHGHGLSDWAKAEFDRTIADAKQAKEDWTKLFGNISDFLNMEVSEGVAAKVERYFEKPQKSTGAEEHDVKDESKKSKGFLEEIRDSISRLVGISPGPEGEGETESAPSGIRTPGGAAQAGRGGFRPSRGGDKSSDSGDKSSGDTTPANVPKAGEGPASVKSLPGGGQTAEQAGIKPEFPVAPGVNWRSLNAEYLARMNAAYRDMPEAEKKKFKMISGYRPATRAEARALGMSESSSQEDIWERSGHGTKFAAAPPGRSKHQGGAAGDYTVTDWIRAHGAQYGVTGIGASYDYPHIQLSPGGRNYLEDEIKRQRDKIDQSDKSMQPQAAIRFDFRNVPRGVKTEANADGMFNKVEVAKSSAPPVSNSQTDTLSRWGVR
jgi:hypothetical protein